MQRNASKHIKHAVSLLTFEKENIPRSSIISPHQNNILIMLHDLYNPTTSNALRASSSFYDNDVYFYSRFFFTHKDRDLFRACHGIDFAHFLFVYMNHSSSLKIKKRWGGAKCILI